MNVEKIVSIEYVGIKDTMDIEVDSENHIFYGNGIATSNSHSVSYAINAFRSAYCKAHDPIKFFEVYLNHAHNKPEKQEEIRELVSDAKTFGIEVHPPTLEHFNKLFTMDRTRSVIYFGYSNVKNVGEGEQFKIEKIVEEAQTKLNKKIEDFTWLDCLFLIGDGVKKNAFGSLISVGAFSGKNSTETRTQMLFEQKVYNSLTEKEQIWIVDNHLASPYKTLKDAINDSINRNSKINSARIKVVMDIYQGLLNPGYSTKDSIEWIADIETKLMGVALTCVKTEGVDTSDVDMTCRDLYNKSARSGSGTVVIQVDRANEYKTKNNEIMCFVSGQDYSGSFDSFVIFPKEYKLYKGLLFNGNTVLLKGEVRERERSLSFIINQIEQR